MWTPCLAYRGNATHPQTATIWLPLVQKYTYQRYDPPHNNRPKEKIHADSGNTLETKWAGNSGVETHLKVSGWYVVGPVDSSLPGEEYSWRRARAGLPKLWGQGQSPLLIKDWYYITNRPTFNKVTVSWDINKLRCDKCHISIPYYLLGVGRDSVF